MRSGVVGGVMVAQYEDYYDVLVQEVPRVNRRENERNFREGGKIWLGIGSQEELARVIDTGWVEGEEKLATKVRALEPPPRDLPRPRMIRDEWGESIDMSEVYAGNFDRAWTRSEHVVTPTQQRYTICVDMGAVSRTTADEMFWPGACAFVIAQGLIKGGRAVRILSYAHNPSVFPRTDFVGAINIKKHNEVLTPDRLALLALAGVYRTVGFKMYCNQEDEACYNMGRSIGLESEKLREYLDIHKNDCLINVPRVRSIDAANEFTTKTYEGLI